MSDATIEGDWNGPEQTHDDTVRNLEKMVRERDEQIERLQQLVRWLTSVEIGPSELDEAHAAALVAALGDTDE